MKRGARFIWPLLCTGLLAASLIGSAAVIDQHQRQTFGALAGLPDADLAPRPNPLAINVALEQYTDREPVYANLTTFHWLRQTFPWDKIEPAPGDFRWEPWDTLVAEAQAHHKEIIAVLKDAPAWARDGEAATAPPHAPDDFARFASALAARYTTKISVYQIWDEPNILLGWGEQPPSAAAYAALLQKAYAAIHAADPGATMLTAALAPTTETGPDNISDLLYLQQLYNLGAGAYFDGAAGKPYGFYSGPDDRKADPAILNFSRFVLLRQVMEKNGDGRKLLWGGSAGWNTRASPWGQTTPAAQVDLTLAAYARALNEWPWAGPLALENYQPAAPADDPHWGFALVDPSGQLTPLGQRLQQAPWPVSTAAFPGNYSALSPLVQYTGEWKFSELGADVSQNYQNAQFKIVFQGSDLALKVRRGDYRGYLYITVDGQPANLLPKDERGAYLVLTSPDLTPQVTTIAVATGLAPDQSHTAIVSPERGWDQWVFVGFSVGRRFSERTFWLALGGLGLAALLGALGAWKLGGAEAIWRVAKQGGHIWKRLGNAGQMLLTMMVGGVLYLSTWLTFGDKMAAVTRRFGDAVPITVTALTAGLFYFSPSALVALAALLVLILLFYLRLDLALAFAALFIPFYLQPRLLWQEGFALVEITTLIALGVWVLQNLRPRLLRLNAQGLKTSRARFNPLASLSSLDWACLALWVVATLSLLTAEFKGFALREYRLVIVDPLIFYFLLRCTPLDRRAWWRIVDFFVLGAVGVAAYGLYQYVTGTDLITAEGGVMRITSVYGSPNNLALYLGRALPIALATAILGRQTRRRVGYTLATLIMAAATLLTFSKGALLFGLPAALVVIAIGWLGRRGWIISGVGAAAGLASLPILSQWSRFANFLSEGGTGFFRLKLWGSAWRMFLDHPVLGVGLDNFLYEYRSKYIQPDAWQDPNLSHPHDMVLDFLSRLGVLGFACGIWLIVGFWRTAIVTFRKPGADPEARALCLGLMASVADMLAHGVVDHSFFLLDLAYAFFLILAAVQYLRSPAQETAGLLKG
jgi:O-antigen ligase